MKINHIPGLALRFFPGLSRDPMEAFSEYTSENSKIVLMTGTAPTESELWNLTDLEAYLTLNNDKIVYSEIAPLKFSYDGYQAKRVIQRLPIDSVEITPLVDPIIQTTGVNPDEIVSDNNLFALIYIPDKDVTLNTQGNDLILLVPNVGTNPDDYLSLSKTDFIANEPIYFRNLTISIFQGYQITDTPITELQDDPENPGQQIEVIVGSKKNVYYNKIWANRLSESYRDCFICDDYTNPKTLRRWNEIYKSIGSWTPYASTTPQAILSINKILYGNSFVANQNFYIRKFNSVTQDWDYRAISDPIQVNHYQYGYVCNQAVIDLLDEINYRAMNKTLPDLFDLYEDGRTVSDFSAGKYLTYHHTQTYQSSGTDSSKEPIVTALTTLLLDMSYKSEIYKISVEKLFVNVLGFDESMVQRAIKCIIPINIDIPSYNSNYDKEANILTVQNLKPMKLDFRYKKTINNPTNEQLYILLNRVRFNGYNISDNYVNHLNNSWLWVSDVNHVSFPQTQQIIDGEPIDLTNDRIKIKDYTAISLGLTGNGDTDLEYDILDNIDYIDSFTAMVKLPNKF